MKHGIRSLCVAFAMTGLSVPFAADPSMLAFGPQSFELTAGEFQLFTESFPSKVNGKFVLHLRNGDGEGSRVAAASAALNGASEAASKISRRSRFEFSWEIALS